MSASEHQSLIKSPKQLIVVFVLGLLVPVIGAVMIATYVVTSSKSPEAGASGTDPKDVGERIKPVAQVVIAEPAGSGAKAAKSGEEIYKGVCVACHGSGAAGAPKFGDKAAWAPRISKGQKTVVGDGLKGKGAMPPKGGASDLSDADFERAVVYMVNASGGSFKEPPAPADTAKK